MKIIRKNKHIKLGSNGKRRIERELLEVKDHTQMVRDVLKNLWNQVVGEVAVAK